MAVLAGCALVPGKCRIENVPDIVDVRNFLKILEFLGGSFEFSGHVVTVDTANLESKPLPAELVGRLRGSILFAGALLGRFGKAELTLPGGDAIGSRPIDQHLDGFRKLGAEVVETSQGFSAQGKLSGARIVLGVSSVTGTENLILAASLARGITEIRMAATEPHVQDLCKFLNLCGAKIAGVGTPILRITGVESLTSANFRIGSDDIEAVTRLKQAILSISGCAAS